MNLDYLNKWLSLIANIIVIAGLFFLSLQINQANRIAVRDGRIDSVNQELTLSNLYIENTEISELLVKLSEPAVELTPLEEFRAEIIAQQLTERMATIAINYDSGFLTDDALNRQVGGLLQILQRVSGLKPYLITQMNLRGIPRTSGVGKAVWDQIEEIGK